MGKGDNRRVEDLAAINKNYDALDWNNDKAPEKPKVQWEWDAEKGEWNEVQEAPKE